MSPIYELQFKSDPGKHWRSIGEFDNILKCSKTLHRHMSEDEFLGITDKCEYRILVKRDEREIFGVYMIVNGCASRMVFEGSKEDCIKFGNEHPELKGNIIIVQLD